MKARQGLFAAALLAAAWGAGAAEAADFYEGKTIHIVSAGAADGNYTLHGRMLAGYLTKYIPGKPVIVVEAMPGGNGLIAANHIFNVAPKDGTYIGLITRDALLLPILDNPQAKFRPEQFQWIGTPESYANSAFIIMVRSALPFKTFDDARKASKPIQLGGQGNNYVTITRDVLGGNFNVIEGYRGGQEIRLALTRGEIDGMGTGYNTVVSQYPQWIAEKFVRFLVQYGHDFRLPDLADVPTARELAKTPDDAALIKFFELALTLGFPFNMPPEVPKDRVDIVREAFAKTMQDPEYQALVKKAGLEMSPKLGADLQKEITEATKISPAVVERAKKMSGETGGKN
jgi:tripartite-type tricarboxylate transporter receptor subunit TctC